MAEFLHLTLLGKLQIDYNGAPMTGFISSKAQALLCYLAVTGRPHFRHSLLGLFWADMPEAEAKANLRVTLSNLRRLVGPYLLITRDSVAFNREMPHRLDVAEFETKLQRTASPPPLDRWQEAVELYQGDFLEGFYIREAPAFEEWVLLQRERLREIALQALHTLATRCTEQGDYLAGINYVTRLLALDPWREEAHQGLMLLLARTGQRRAALTQYETCRRILAQELGVTPLPETMALYERLQRLGLTPRANLPPQPTPFIGRTEELVELSALLANPTCRLITLVGSGGIGKSRLAIQAAAQKADAFLEGICFVSLASLSSSHLLAATIAAALDLPASESIKEPEIQLINYLRAKEILLVLDNFEHILKGSEGGSGGESLITTLLENAPGIKILITSRERLNLRWEWVFDLEGLPFPEQLPATPAELEGYEAVQLFLESARRVQRRFVLSEDIAPCVLRICQRLNGIPLGLELAAASLRKWSCSDIGDMIDTHLDHLTASFQDIPERHRSLRAVFDHSWQLLSPEEQQCLRRLSVFRGGFEEEAASQVVDAAPATLVALVEKSLLRRPGPSRYARHNLVWQYAYERFEQHPEEIPQIKERHAAYYTSFLEQKEAELRVEEQKAALDEIGLEIENIRLAWHWTLDQGNWDQILQALEGLYLFYDTRGWFSEGIERFEQVVNRLATAGLWFETEVKNSFPSPELGLLLGRAMARQGALAQRLAHYEVAIDRNRAGQFLSELEVALSPPERASAQAPDPSLSLEPLMTNLLEELTAQPQPGF